MSGTWIIAGAAGSAGLPQWPGGFVVSSVLLPWTKRWNRTMLRWMGGWSEAS